MAHFLIHIAKQIKRIIILAAIIFYADSFGQASSHLHAQAVLLKTRIELFAGPSSVRFYSHDISTKDAVFKFGYLIGIGIVKPITRNFEVRSRLSWERKGWKERPMGWPPTNNNHPIPYERITRGNKMDYLTLSVIPEIKVGKRRQFGIGAGAYYSLIQRGYTFEVQYLPWPTKRTVTWNVVDGFTKNDYGASINLSYSFPETRHKLISVHLLNNYGLKQIIRYPTLNYHRWYNNTWSLVFSIAF